VNPVRVTACAILLAASAAMPGIHDPARERNPRQLRAMQLLDRRKLGVPPRVRFEWDPVAGARRYALTGRWTSPPSWTIQSASYGVTPKNATVWEPRRVAFELSIADGAGTYSWSVVALFGPDEHGDFAHPTTVSFDVR
jgi:hypothetical protein